MLLIDTCCVAGRYWRRISIGWFSFNEKTSGEENCGEKIWAGAF